MILVLVWVRGGRHSGGYELVRTAMGAEVGAAWEDVVSEGVGLLKLDNFSTYVSRRGGTESVRIQLQAI